jgi:hypothetical protein
MGADGAATLGVAGNIRTARQAVHKLRVVGDSLIIGTSGPMGLGQRFAAELERLHSTKDKLLRNTSPEFLMASLRLKFLEHIKPEFEAAILAKDVVGLNAAQSSAVSNTMVALPVGNRCCLFQFDHQAAPEMATKDLPFVALGSGQLIADPFLAFLRRVLWGHRGLATDQLPSLGDGIAAALWTLDHAIKTNPGGVAEPIQVAILRSEGGAMKARELSELELDEHLQAISAMEGGIRPAWEVLRGPGETGPPPKPVPTPAV